MEPLVFYHAPNTRSFGTRVLLEELGLPYTMHVLNMKAAEQRSPAYLAVNPMGKVPAIMDGTALVTEQVAITLFLADMVPAAKLAPVIGDALRGPYLRWIAFYGSSFEPAVVDAAMKREPGATAMSPYGSFDTVLDVLEVQLAAGPWLLGERFTAADVLWGAALNWTLAFGLVPERPGFAAYAERVRGRPAYQAAFAADAELAAAHAAAADAASP
jgi:glutathione S-transferase